MGMPVTVEIADANPAAGIRAALDYFEYVDSKFSTYKDTSEISAINRGELPAEEWSGDMRAVFGLAEETKAATGGFFDIRMPAGGYDPSGLVKGWAIWKAAKLLKDMGYRNFYVDAGGDIEVSGRNAQGENWSVGIRNPWNRREVVKTVRLRDRGIATSGSYIRGGHIYNPLDPEERLDQVLSLTVIGPNIYEADRFATAAFAMGLPGISFIERLPGFEGYMIDSAGIGTETSGFQNYAYA